VTPLAYPAEEAARMLGISKSTFLRHVRHELPPPVYIGGCVVWKHADLERWLHKS
jgi:predicted DNA-binding transcriptional regulator AlpA